jgi:hypothetical protein
MSMLEWVKPEWVCRSEYARVSTPEWGSQSRLNPSGEAGVGEARVGEAEVDMPEWLVEVSMLEWVCRSGLSWSDYAGLMKLESVKPKWWSWSQWSRFCVCWFCFFFISSILHIYLLTCVLYSSVESPSLVYPRSSPDSGIFFANFSRSSIIDESRCFYFLINLLCVVPNQQGFCVLHAFYYSTSE